MTSPLFLGIDTGGTYTDAVLADHATDEVLASAKSLTTPQDLAVGITGLVLRHWVRSDLVSVKELCLSLVAFKPVSPARLHWLLFTHLALVCTLLCYLPFSKLVHLGGVFMSPTRNMANNNRAVRHVNPWNHPVKVHSYEEYEDEFRDKLKASGYALEKE